jgi:hypothetical protein
MKHTPPMNADLKKVLDNILPEGIFLEHILCELLEGVDNAPVGEYKEKYIHNWLDENIDKNLLLKSFDHKVILVYDEVITIEILEFLHLWFKKNACNIKNIIVILTHSYSLSNWYTQYCNLYGCTGFTIISVPWIYAFYFSFWRDKFEIKKNKQYPHKQLEFYFDYYGGQQSSYSRDFTAAALLTVPVSKNVEYLAGYRSTIEEFDAYLEQISGFCNRDMCDEILAARKNKKFSNLLLSNSISNMLGVSNQIIGNKTAFTVIRETLYDEPILTLTEKTLKAFLDMIIPMPIGFKSIDGLTELGFKFDHSLIDYSYQHEIVFFDRILRLIKEIARLSNTYTLQELSERIYNNKSIVEYNYNYIASGELFNNVQTKFIRDLNEQRL